MSYSRHAVDQLAGNGYRFFQITDRGFVPSARMVPVVRDRFAFLNYLLTTKTTDEVERVFSRLKPTIQKIDLKQTSKYLSPGELERFVARMEGEDSIASEQDTPNGSGKTQMAGSATDRNAASVAGARSDPVAPAGTLARPRAAAEEWPDTGDAIGPHETSQGHK